MLERKIFAYKFLCHVVAEKSTKGHVEKNEKSQWDRTEFTVGKTGNKMSERQVMLENYTNI